MPANTYSWIATLGIISPLCIGIVFPFTRNVTPGSSSEGLGFNILMFFIILPIAWFVPTSFYTAMRAIFIVMTPNRKREIFEEEIKEVEVIGVKTSSDNQ